MNKEKLNTISDSTNIIEGSGRANIYLQKGTKLIIENALFSPKSLRNLLSFKDISKNGYHIETMNEMNIEYLCILKYISGKKYTLEKLSVSFNGLYYAKINNNESYSVVNRKFTDLKMYTLWHDRLGHPGSTMMRRIIENSFGHPLKNIKIMTNDEFTCTPCYQGKLIIRPSPTKVGIESPAFLERIHGDICGPVDPPCGNFRYFMVLIDASSRWSHVCLLSSRNMAFARLLAQIIRLRAQFPDYQIKNIRLDNAAEFSSRAFNDYCLSIGINVEHPVAHVHTQNGLAESFIKRLQWIARPLLMKSNLPISAWGHAIMHASILVKIRPTSYHKYSPVQLAFGHEPDISHFRIFGCAVYVPVAPPQRTKMGSQRRLGIYIGFESPSIIRYLEPLTGDLFTARFADCRFDETNFPSLGVSKKEIKRDLTWKTPSLFHFDPRSKSCELEVQKIIHLQDIANKLPDAFVDSKRVTKSHIPAANIPVRINIPEVPLTSRANESKARLKRGRPLGSKDKTPRRRKMSINEQSEMQESQINEEIQEIINHESPEELHDPQTIENLEQPISITSSGGDLNRTEVIIDHIFSYNVALNIMQDNIDPKSVQECRLRNDWPKWKEAIQSEINSLNKREVFGPVVRTPTGIKPIGYKWVFVRKMNQQNEVVRYKARLVAQGFSQKPGIDYDETYSPVMDTITFRYLLSMAAHEKLEMRLMDVVTAYLYGSLDSDIFMKIPEGFKMPEAHNSQFRDMHSVKLQRSLYGLKQSGRMWYNRLSEYLLKEGYTNDQICPCIFIRKTICGFVIIAVYVDDINLIGTHEEIQKVTDYLKREFEMKDLGLTKFCLGLQIEHFPEGIFVHQSNYMEKVLKRFYMDNAHPLSTPMVVRSLDVNKDPFRPYENNDEILGPEVPYLSAIGALMYLANTTRPDIAFSVNVLARYSSAPTRRHWNGIKHILRYIKGTIDMGLFYSNTSRPDLIGYADAGYLSDPHKARSQTGYLFTYGGTAISWRSTKQTLTATSSNHAEIIAIHEASRECVWLRSMTHLIREKCGFINNSNKATVLFEDNAACIAQLKEGFIKGDRTKHISPKFFFTHDLQKKGEIDIQQIRSCDNLADMFTKSLPAATFKKLVYKIGLRRFKDICVNGGRNKIYALHSFCLYYGFLSHWVFLDKVFNEAAHKTYKDKNMDIQGGVL
jgi:hypothetical protein